MANNIKPWNIKHRKPYNNNNNNNNNNIFVKNKYKNRTEMGYRKMTNISPWRAHRIMLTYLKNTVAPEVRQNASFKTCNGPRRDLLRSQTVPVKHNINGKKESSVVST